MLLTNYHTHTTRCWHAVGTDREYIEAAIRGGFKVLGFADHAPYAFPNGFLSLIRMFPDTIDEYFTSLLALKEEYKDQIEIKIGFETEYYPDLFEDFLKRLAPYPCDYLLLGQHSIFNEYDHNDTPPRGTMEYVNRYVDQVCEAMRTGYFTYLAHPDLAYCEGYPPEYYRTMEKLIECAIETDTPLEVRRRTHGGTSGIIGKGDCAFGRFGAFRRFRGQVFP